MYTTHQRTSTRTRRQIMQGNFTTGRAEILVAAVTAQDYIGLVIAYHTHGAIVYHKSAFNERLSQKTYNIGQRSYLRTVYLILVVAGSESFRHQSRHGKLGPRITLESNGIGVYGTIVNAAKRSKVGSRIVAATQ